MTEKKDILHAEDVAKELGKSKQTIYRWIKNGQFPHGKSTPGGQIWTRKKLLDWASYGQATAKELKTMASLGN